MKKILILTANPKGAPNLRLEDEIRKIKDEIKAGTVRDSIEIHYEPSVQIKTITRALQVYKPYIVHFSGHGSGSDGLVVLNEHNEVEYFPNIFLEKLFKLHKHNIKCVILNACYSAEQAKIISQSNIYVIGMNNKISDKAATDFAVGFYQSIADGTEIKEAFQIGLINNGANVNEANTPELWRAGKLLKL